MPAQLCGQICKIMKNKKSRNDIILISAVLLATAIVALILCAFRKEGGYVSVVQNGKETARYSLSENVTVTLENGGTNVLVIENGVAIGGSISIGKVRSAAHISLAGGNAALPVRVIVQDRGAVHAHGIAACHISGTLHKVSRAAGTSAATGIGRISTPAVADGDSVADGVPVIVAAGL